MKIKNIINLKKQILFFCCVAFFLFSGYLSAQADDSIGKVRYIIVAALPDETPNLENYAPVVFTGVGKVNASIKMYEAVLKYKPDLVLNYGTAGGVSGVSGLLKIGTFIQRDMDASALNYPKGVTPFDNKPLPKKQGIVLGTGDSFVTDTQAALEGLDIEVDLVDMEGFALKEVADHLKVKFIAYKYISDQADENAASDWEKTVQDGAKYFSALLEKEYGKSALLK